MAHSPVRLLWLLAPASVLLVAAPARAQLTAQPLRPTGRVSFYTDTSRISTGDVAPVTTGTVITNITYGLPDAEGDGYEYGLNMRHAADSNPNRTARVSMYDGYVGRRFLDGRVRVRAGQMWLNDLGGLGSIAGAAVEYKRPLTDSRIGRLRVGGFFGVEPKTYELGFTRNIRKIGAYATLEGHGGRRHVVGYVRMADRNLVERSVVTTTNFVPIRSRVFVYQAAEYDLVGPAGQGSGGLTYFMTNAHAALTDRLDVQGLYHRGRSLDTRSITEDVLAGRPLRDGVLDALLYASAGARVSARITRDVRVNAGYTRDKNNRDSAATGRLTFGVSFSDLAGTGVDLTTTESRVSRPTGQYNSIYVSLGRQIGRTIYVSGDYSSSASIVQFTRSDGITIETRPHSEAIGTSAVIAVGRDVSLTMTAERTRDAGVLDIRVLAGLTYRLR